MVQRKLDFVIGGAQKGGTSSLFLIFCQHHQIQMAATKETHFFDDESADWRHPDYSKLHAYFAADDGRLRGEATPITLYWRPAIRRLRDYNPDMKFIILLRNPATRAFSNWRHEIASGRENVPFNDAIRGGRSRVGLHAEVEGLHRYVSYVERGFYGQQLSYLLEFFPKRNVHCEISEEFFENRRGSLQRMAAFLGIDQFPADLPEFHANQAANIPYSSTMTDDDVAYLAELYRDDIKMIESLLERPILNWRNFKLATGSGLSPAGVPRQLQA